MSTTRFTYTISKVANAYQMASHVYLGTTGHAQLGRGVCQHVCFEPDTLDMDFHQTTSQVLLGVPRHDPGLSTLSWAIK